MSSNKKNKQKKIIQEKYLYYIPCYDIVNNEIFFSEFFTEKIIKKPKNIDKNNNIISSQFKIPLLFEGKLLKKRKNRNQKKKYEKDTKSESKERKYIKELPKISNKSETKSYNTNIEKIKKKKNIKKIIDSNKEKLLLEKFCLNWRKMQIISGFNKNNYLSDNYIKYFSRPIYNKFFHSQDLNLYSFNSTLPLSKTMSNRLYTNIYIHYDIDSFFSFPKNKRNEYILNYIKSAFMTLSQTPRQVSLFYIVDTLIKDSLKIFENFVLNLLDNLESENDLDEYLKKENEQNNLDSDDEISLKEIDFIKRDEDLKNKVYEFLISMKKRFTILKSDLNNRFIFKFYDSEEFLYGNYTIGSFNYIRNKARQHEGINLLLQYYPLHKISPPLMSYPPIIKIEKNKDSYETLFKLYLDLFPKHEIIYRLGKPSNKEINRYLKKDTRRTKYLTKYSESGDCNFPLKINIRTLNNINSFKKWLNNDLYNNIEINLPYFNTLKKLSLQNNNNIFKNLFSRCFTKKEEEENDNKKNNINDSQSYENFYINYNKNKKSEKELITKLNPYNFISYYKNEKYNSYYKLLLNYAYYHLIFDSQKDQNNSNNDNYNIDSTKFEFLEYYSLKQKFLPFFTLEKYPFLFIPIYIRIKVYILYGCFCVKKFYTKPYLIKDFILLNENIVLDGNEFLISHLPYETRIGLTIKAFDSKFEKKYILGSCQIPLYKDTGEFNSGEIEYQFWPNVKIFPRVVFSTPFSKKKKEKEKKGNINLPILDVDDNKIVQILENCKEYISSDFKKMLEIKEEENTMKERNKQNKYNDIDNEEEENEESDEVENENLDEENNEKNVNEIEYLNNYKENYPSVNIELPRFNKPLIHNVMTVNEYKNFLGIKYKDEDFFDTDFDEVRNLYANSQIDLNNIMKNLSNRYDHNMNISENKNKNNPKDIFNYLKKSLPLLIKVLKKDPLEYLTQEETKVILICRDYISTIPSALELFLRSINWFNPLEVSIAYKYLQKWSKLEAEDALSLLDCRFPDTKVRLYAVNILREYPDEIIQSLMLMLCQCLLYENFIVNPLSDFLIERSLRNPKLIGNYFILYNRVNMKNPFFEEKLSCYILQFLMLCGNKYLEECFDKILNNYYLELFTYASNKKQYSKNKIAKSKKNTKENLLIEYYNKAFINNKKMKFLIDPSYVCYKLTDSMSISSSNFLQVLLSFKTGKNEDSPERKIILRLGNDLRQDVLAIQILKCMDKLWLDNNLDLKLITFMISPSDLFSGYIEYVNFIELYKIQNSSGIIGVLDKEAIIKFLRGTGNIKENDNGIILDDETYEERVDNFIKSLAGYCVATCVLGITERSFRNVMIKNNGILLHVNLGHLLGHFKYKCGIKTERSLFLLTTEMANVYINENKQEVFKKCCTKAFNILRHNASKIINPLIIMSTAGLKNFYGINDINYIKKMLVLDIMNDEDAGNYFLEQIWKCKNEKLRQIDSLFRFIK